MESKRRRVCRCHPKFRLEELKLWNDMIFVDVPKHNRLVCSQCGSANVKVMPIFPPAKGAPGYKG
jgi:hypothetical protein